MVCLAQFMVILDVSIVNVALPSIHDGLGFSETGLQWVVNAYTLTFAGFLLLGGRASDLLGRRRVFLVGIALFGARSLVCAIAQNQGMLLGARALQGIGAAVISPASLAIIASSFAEGHERNRALGAWSAMAGLGGTSGVLLGGLLTDVFDWPAIFLINAPIAAAVVCVRPAPDRARRRRRLRARLRRRRGGHRHRRPDRGRLRDRSHRRPRLGRARRLGADRHRRRASRRLRR